MEVLIGTGLAISVGLAATFTGLDRDRAFYPTVVAVVSTYYALFAVMGGSLEVLGAESIVVAGFLGAAIVGFKRSPWLVVAALAAHGGFDLVHGHLIENSGMPAWWPGFCSSYDIAAAAYLAMLLSIARRPQTSSAKFS
jgi:hypothetical protein